MDVETLQRTEASLETQALKKAKKNTVSRVEYIGLPQKQLNKKRILDLFVFFCVSPILLPLSLIIAILIKLDSKGPILFTQKRVGQGGKPFLMYKFRSMKIDSEVNGCMFAKRDDHRITKFGKFIRKFRIDEIPQFWNVLKGDMSLIGPRPEQARFVEFFNEEIYQYDLRHSIKPGITGLAQVQQGYAASKRGTEMKLNYDLYYIRNYSLKMDLVIVAKTLKTIFTGFGAR